MPELRETAPEPFLPTLPLDFSKPPASCFEVADRTGKAVSVGVDIIRASPTHYTVRINGLAYDIPIGSYSTDSLILRAKTAEGLYLPIAVASASMTEGTPPTIVMIQRINASTISEPKQAESLASAIKIIFGATYSRAPHPLQQLIQGETKIDWAKILLERFEQMAKKRGFSALRLQSGFKNIHVTEKYPLAMLVQQYDLLVVRLPGWLPYSEDDALIGSVHDSNGLGAAIRALNRREKVFTAADLLAAYPNVVLPAYWEKKLVNTGAQHSQLPT